MSSNSIIVHTHRSIDARSAKGENHLCSFVHYGRERFKLRWRKPAEHKINLLPFGIIVADAEPQPGIILATEQQLYIIKAIMTRAAAALAHA